MAIAVIFLQKKTKETKPENFLRVLRLLLYLSLLCKELPFVPPFPAGWDSRRQPRCGLFILVAVKAVAMSYSQNEEFHRRDRFYFQFQFPIVLLEQGAKFILNATAG